MTRGLIAYGVGIVFALLTGRWPVALILALICAYFLVKQWYEMRQWKAAHSPLEEAGLTED